MIKRTGHRYIDVKSGITLDSWFPKDIENLDRSCPAERVGFIKGNCFDIEIDIHQAPQTTEDIYLRLHLMSERSIKPNEINLDGIFEILPNLAWTNAGPILISEVTRLKKTLSQEHFHLQVSSLDKFPRMTDYVIPDGVRVSDADRVRLGAYLASGTTVMPEGFVNFNAGTLGTVMVEGRLSQGVTVNANSDIGGGASIMGSLTGGGRLVNQIGQRSLMGANAGIGISLGDECIVEAGLYITAGTKVTKQDGSIVYAKELSGVSNLLFRRNSQSGTIEVLPTSCDVWGGVNPSLHTHN